MTHRARPRTPEPSRVWSADLRWGLSWGAWTAGFFTVLAVLGRVLSGSDEAFARRHMSFVAYVAYLWAIGVAGGAAAAALRPWLTRAWAAAALGWLVLTVAISGVFLLEAHPVGEAVGPALWLGPVGAVAGLLMRWRWQGRTRAGSRRAEA